MGVCVRVEGVSCVWVVNEESEGGKVAGCVAVDAWADLDGLAWLVAVIFTVVDCVTFVFALSYLGTEKERQDQNQTRIRQHFATKYSKAVRFQKSILIRKE